MIKRLSKCRVGKQRIYKARVLFDGASQVLGLPEKVARQWGRKEPMTMDGNFYDADAPLQILLSEEVAEIVKRAAVSGGTLQVAPHARRLRLSEAGLGLSPRSIADELILAAARAGIPVEMDRAD